ncbi:hypothetical protein [Macrococcus sp. DPC7161]|uniref:hypothetical protein n=1 Tax=Macrococcus sp. DPC7161 TaxID=2507060 RepID=UPI00100B843E|nr:hypothetical protein [Macrococcus sp. DPC7161]RXK18498.1 hypothetical protein ER639_04275 [Macrococcus sp. DPC7161]
MKSAHSSFFHMNYALSIMLFIGPLFILSMSSMNIAYANETRWLELLLSYSIKSVYYILVHYFSIVTVYTFVLFTGHIILVIMGLPLNLKFFLLSFIMILLCASAALFVGIVSNTRLKAVGYALVLWTLMLIIMPFILITLNGYIPGNKLLNLMILNIHLNPVDYIRMAFYLLTHQKGILGSEMYEYVSFLYTPTGILLFVLNGLLLVILPLIIAFILLKRRGFK